jgi:hypothetical protein
MKRSVRRLQLSIEAGSFSLWQTSFLPPVLSLLDRHFAAVQAKSRAEAHVKALKALSGYAERIQKLETAIWAGRGADEWVVSDLTSTGFGVIEGHDTLQNTRPLQLAQVCWVYLHWVARLANCRTGYGCLSPWWRNKSPMRSVKPYLSPSLETARMACL